MSNYSNLTAQQLRKAADLQDKIVDLQKQLAALLGGSAPKASAVEKPKKRRKMSAAARAKIGAAQRARWAKVNAK